IAPSYADIFYNNCFKNGILPIILPKEDVAEIMQDAHNELEISIDLEKQTVIAGNQKTYSFDIDPFRKHCLLNGLDDIGLTMAQQTHIDDFEQQQKERQNWLYV